MTLPRIDRIGEWNPQLFREIKGRLKPRNILIAVTISLVGQLLVLMSFVNHLPDVPVLSEEHSPIYNRYCTGTLPYPKADVSLCSLVGSNSFEINWQVWCQDVFVCLSIIGIFALLVGGTYMLVNDLSKEEQRGTLNVTVSAARAQALLGDGGGREAGGVVVEAAAVWPAPGGHRLLQGLIDLWVDVGEDVVQRHLRNSNVSCDCAPNNPPGRRTRCRWR